MTYRSLAVGLTLALTTLAAFAEPSFFTDKPYAEAKTHAAQNDKLLLVKATAVWCGPCKQMDRTTFKDKKLIEWLEANAVSVSVDVDDEPATSRELRIRAMPTMVLFRGDEELARVVGYRSADQLLSWLQAAEGGNIVPAAEKAPPAENDIDGRLERARELVGADAFAEATDEFLWLWDNMVTHKPSMSGVRVSFMASNMSELAKRSPEAKQAFIKLRDRTEDRMIDQEEKSWDDLRDWLVLNERVLHDREPIRKWIHRIKDRPTAMETFSRTQDIIDGVLIDDGEWAIFGSLIKDPMRDIQMAKMIRELDKDKFKGDEDMRAAMKSANDRMLRDGVSKTVAALLAAQREVEAREVADAAIRLLDDDAMRAAIVEMSLKAQQPRAWHLELLNSEALRALRDRVDAALRG